MHTPSHDVTTSGGSDIVHAAIDLRRFSWNRPLVTALWSDFASVAPLFAGDPADTAAWAAAIARAQAAPRDRERFAGVVQAQLVRRGSPEAAHRAAAALADRRAVAIVTGQQAGLFGGPLYTALKAVTTIQLARRIEAEHGVPAVPVFWVESEDHDWEEVRSASLLDADQQLRRVTVADVDGAGAQPVARLVLDEGINEALDALTASLAPSEFTAEVVEHLRRSYRTGVTVTTAFASWIDDLFGSHGLVVFEAADPAAKPLVRDLFVRELRDPARTVALVRESAAAMQRLGHEPPIAPADDHVALFYFDQRGRTAIRGRGGALTIGEASRSADDLASEAEQHPERFSPNVLLRPLVQDRLFPTAAYVGGPTEIAYQAELGALYRDCGIPAPLLYPRASATLVDAAAIRFFDRYHVSLEALHEREDAALKRLIEAELSPAVDRALEETEQELVARARGLKDAVVSVDPTLAGAVDTTLDRIRETLKSLHGKILQAAKRKDETLRRQFTRTHTLVFPDGHPQERVLCGVFFANRHGLRFADRLIGALPLDTSKHYVVRL